MASVIKIESFDVDVASASTHTLTTTVSSLNSAFVRRTGPADKQSGGPIGSTANTNPIDVVIGAQLTATNTVTFYAGSATSRKVMGEVWRYTGTPGGIDEFIVRGRFAISVTGTSSASQAVSGIVNEDDCVPFLQGVSNTLASVNDYDASCFTAHMDGLGNVVVSKNNTSGNHTVYVTVVEFTGSRWSVGHGVSSAHDTVMETVTLNTDSTGTGGSTFDVTNWDTAIIEATVGGDSAETGLADNLCLCYPGVSTTQAIFGVTDGDGNARNDATGYIHVMRNEAMAVYRASNSNIAEGNNTYGTASWPPGAPTTAALDELALEWYSDTSGTGTAHARGRLVARITAATGTIQHWVHRSGNNVNVRYGVIDLTNVDNVQRPSITNVEDEAFAVNEADVLIEGSLFEAVQGTGSVILSDTSTFGSGTEVTQTVNTWSDTQINIDLVQGALPEGTLYLFVENDSGVNSSGYPVTVGEGTYTSIVATYNPDHHWPLDGDFLDNAGSINANSAGSSGTAFTADVLTRGSTQSVQCNATTDFFSMSNSTAMNNGSQNARTMGGWIQLGAVIQTLTNLYEEGGNVNNFAILLGFGNIVLCQAADTGDFYVQAFSDIKLTVDRPYFVIFQFRGSTLGNEFWMLLDGVKQTVTQGNPPGATDMDSHTGDIHWGDAGGSLEVGGTDIDFPGPSDCQYAHWMTWSTSNYISDTDVADLFAAGAPPQVSLSTDTAANMQTAMAAYNNTTRTDWPLSFRIPQPTDSSNLEITATNMVFDDRVSLQVRWMGAGTLTWRNSGTSNLVASKVSLAVGGTVTVIETATITVTVTDITTGLPVENARVFIEADSGGPLAAGTDILNSTTNASGVASVEIDFSSNQPITGRVRKGTAATYYRTSAIVGTVTSAGLSLGVALIPDQ